jgi:hypothetical protein
LRLMAKCLCAGSQRRCSRCPDQPGDMQCIAAPPRPSSGWPGTKRGLVYTLRRRFNVFRRWIDPLPTNSAASWPNRFGGGFVIRRQTRLTGGNVKPSPG